MDERMSHAGFLGRVSAAIHSKESYQRTGQVYFNELYMVHPNLANSLVGTGLDPYYSEFVTTATSWHVEENWENFS